MKANHFESALRPNHQRSVPYDSAGIIPLNRVYLPKQVDTEDVRYCHPTSPNVTPVYVSRSVSLYFHSIVIIVSNAVGDTAYSQEHLKTKVYAKFGGKQSVFWGIRKIENLDMENKLS